MKPLKLGIIGLSEGNGHPYSWSAIFNGYDSTAMEECGFQAIPRYLEKQQFPKDAIAFLIAKKTDIAFINGGSPVVFDLFTTFSLFFPYL